MKSRAWVVVLSLALAAFFAKTAAGQVVLEPTPNPTVTAENEPWYLNGEPITYAGTLYYPAGPRVHFSPNEMVRSGFFMGIPLYTRTTIEPYSVVYVPVGPGLLQPYERPRTGQLAETSGSLARSLPPTPGGETAAGAPRQAAGPPAQTTRVIPMQLPRPVGTTGGGETAPQEPRAVGTSGRVTPSPRAPRAPRARSGGKAPGPHALFIEFNGDRWYMAGPAETIDTARMARIGSYAETPVWWKPGDDATIYVPVTQGGGSLAVPYTRKR